MGQHRTQVQDWMTREPTHVNMETSLADGYELMGEMGIRRLPVVRNDELVGIVTLSDILRAIPALLSEEDRDSRLLAATRKIGEIMTWDPVTIDPEDTIQDAAERMLEYQVSGLPVVDGPRLVGIITESDIFRLVVESWAED